MQRASDAHGHDGLFGRVLTFAQFLLAQRGESPGQTGRGILAAWLGTRSELHDPSPEDSASSGY